MFAKFNGTDKIQYGKMIQKYGILKNIGPNSLSLEISNYCLSVIYKYKGLVMEKYI
jgi:hypothetical protein